VHAIMDNYSTHKHQRVKRWLALRSRIHVHYTPAYTSWLSQVEIRFHRITGRGTLGRMRELAEKIDRYVHTYHPTAQPFVWTATAGSIFAKVQR
jgi:putative transposase